MAQYLVSGTLTPDATGTYSEAGTYNGATYFQNGSWYLYLVNPGIGEAWYISTQLEDLPAEPWWVSDQEDILGTYHPAGTEAIGTATVTLVSSTVSVDPLVLTLTVIQPPIRVIAPAVTATWSVVSPGRVATVSPVAAAWSVAAPILAKQYPVDAVAATWSAVTPATAQTRTIEVSPVVATWSIPALGGTYEAVSPIAATWTVPAVTTGRIVRPAPITLTWSVVAPEKRVTPDALVLTWTPVVPQVFRGRYYFDCRGLFRIFNAAVYRLYRSNVAPPAESDVPWTTSATLPVTPADAFADGTWWISVSYFNGVLDSGFLALGDRGETYRKLVISGGVASADPPQAPIAWHLERQAGGVVRIIAVAYAAVASEWTVGYTDDGSDPAEDSSDVTATLAAGMSVWEYDLPAAAHGATVKVRVQVRRNDGTVGVPVWVYSDGSAIQSVTADATGPSAPVAAERSEQPVVEV